MSDAVYQWEKLDALLADGFEDLLVAHWQEVALDQQEIPLVVDWDRYREMEKAGSLKILSLRIEGKFVGYSAWFVNYHMHYKTTLHALNDVIYLDPDYRGEYGVRLILKAEQELRKLGVRKVLYHAKEDLALVAGKDGDSLETVEHLMDIEIEFGVKLPDDLFDTKAGGCMPTMGDVLCRIGYRHIENVYAKLL